MGARRCTICGISYPFNHTPECDVCQGKLDNIGDKADADWEDVVESHKRAGDNKAKAVAARRDWKLLMFMNQGFAHEAAVMLIDWKVDHHVTARMVANGCTLGLVMEIMAPDELPPAPVQEAEPAVQ